METTTNGGEMYTDRMQTEWDSEKRSSPYSTVSNPYEDDTYCEGCDSEVTYKDKNDTHGTCKCNH